MSRPSVSVHIVTYNSAVDIEACLEAVRRQVYPVERIIVVDNASQDGTQEVLKAYGGDGRLHLVLNDTNRGFAGGHNQAIGLTDTDYCLILNPDVLLHPDYLSHLIQYAEEGRHVRLGALTGKLLRQEPAGVIDSCGLRMTASRRAFDLGSGEPAERWTEPMEVFGVSGAAALYRREMIRFVSVGGEFFDESFFAYKEDVDVAWRAGLMGWTAVFVPSAEAVHKRGWKEGGRRLMPLFVRRLSYINRYKMMVKNDRLHSILRQLLPILAYECASLGYMLLREPKVLLAWFSFIREWKELRRKRRHIQANLSNFAKNFIPF